MFLQILGLRYFRTSCNKALALTKVPTQARSSWVEQQSVKRVLSRNMEFSVQVRLGNRTPRLGVSLCNSLRMCVSAVVDALG